MPILSNPALEMRSSDMGEQLEPSDADLVLACRKREAAAWSMLVQRYQRLIYTIPRRAGLDEDQAAEVFQLTFVKLLEHIHTIEHPERIRAWLVTTARREAWRLSRRQSLDEPIANAEYQPDENLSPGEALEDLERQHLIQMALSAVDERCRRLLTLLFYCPEPPPYADVAATLGVAQSSLSPTRARCLQKVSRLLKRLAPDVFSG